MTNDNERGTRTVTLTEQQRQHVLSGLANELLDAKRYLMGPEPSEKPGPLDDCCDAHRARWRDSVDLHASLTAKKKSIKATVAVFLDEGKVF